jgi:hypothetical protein
MQFRKIISLWAILALAFAQIAIAQHSAAHLDHGFESIQTQQHAAVDHDGDKDPSEKPHDCPECQLTKGLQTVIPSETGLFVGFMISGHTASMIEAPFVSIAVASSYNPRAPPSFSI